MVPKQTVLITGCSDHGIGYGLTAEFQKRDYHVFATTRNVSTMSKLRELPNVTLLELDVVNPGHVKAAVEAVTEATGGTLDVLINNAGQSRFRPILDEDIDEAKALFDVHLFGPLALTKAFAPLVIKAKGTFAFTTSVAGYLNSPWMGTYAASKRSLEIIAETLRLEVQPFGCNVIEFVTGAVESQGLTKAHDWALPGDSLYKSIEKPIWSRAQGNDGIPRMPLGDYAVAVTDAIVERTSGKFWYGQNADMVKMSTTSTTVPQSAMDAAVSMGTGLDELRKDAK